MQRREVETRVEVEIKLHGVTTRGGGERVRGELGLLWREEDGLEGSVLDGYRMRNAFLVGVGVSKGLSGS